MFATIEVVNVALALHILGVVFAFGVLLAVPVAAPALRRASPESGRTVAGLQLALAQTVVRWGGLLVLLSGIYMAADLDLFSEWWVTTPLVILFVIFGFNDGFLVPRYRELVQDAQDEVKLQQTAVAERGLALLVLLAVLVMVLGPYV